MKNKNKKNILFLFSIVTIILCFFVIFLFIKQHLKSESELIIKKDINLQICEDKNIKQNYQTNLQFEENEIPVYKLNIKCKDLDKLYKNLPRLTAEDKYFILTKKYKKEVQATFFYNDKKYDVNVMYRGDLSNHWSEIKKSWNIKFNKDELFFGQKKLKLLIPEDRLYYADIFNNYRAKKMGLIVPETYFAELIVNETSNGIYYVIEDWDKAFLETKQRTADSNFYINVDGNNTFAKNEQIFSNINFWKKTTENPIIKNDFSEMNLLLDLINNASQDEFNKKIFNILDENNFYKWNVHYTLVGDSHQNNGENMRLYFNNVKGKFELIPWDVTIYGLNNRQSIDDRIENIDLAEKILENPVFLNKRNQILWDYVTDDKNLEDDLQFYDSVYSKTKTIFESDTLNQKNFAFYENQVKQTRQFIIDHFYFVKEKLISDFNFK